jgi:hypothetical protein
VEPDLAHQRSGVVEIGVIVAACMAAMVSGKDQ